MKVITTRFGEVEIEENETFFFPEGLIGFGRFKQYFFLANPTGGPFEWLQAVEPPDLAFVVADPGPFAPDYNIKVKADMLQPIELTDVSQAVIRVILVVPRGNPMAMTANLQGPLVMNMEKRLGMQLVLTDAGYSTRHPVFPEGSEIVTPQRAKE